MSRKLVVVETKIFFLFSLAVCSWGYYRETEVFLETRMRGLLQGTRKL
jgi:hypothetical protein